MVKIKTIQKKTQTKRMKFPPGLFELIPMDSKVAMSGAAWKKHPSPVGPIPSMVGWHIYLHLPYKSTVNVGKYIIHGWVGVWYTWDGMKDDPYIQKPSQSLRLNLKMMVSKRNHLFQVVVFSGSMLNLGRVCDM